MTPELSHRLAEVLGTHVVSVEERQMVEAAAIQVETWEELPASIQALVVQIEARPWYGEDTTS